MMMMTKMIDYLCDYSISISNGRRRVVILR
jgi:hypothetical protein